MWDTRSRDGCCLILRANSLFPEKEENTSRNQGCLAWHGLTYYLRFFRRIFQHVTSPSALHRLLAVQALKRQEHQQLPPMLILSLKIWREADISSFFTLQR